MRQSAGLAVLTGLLAGWTTLGAAEAPWIGFQAGGAVPVENKLRTTAGAGFQGGIHLDWNLDSTHALRPRVDFMGFGARKQAVTTPFIQQIDTKVQAMSLGVELLFRHDGPRGKWAMGPGIYAIRWSVKSTNQLEVPGAGVARLSGTSHWTRAGLGFAVTRRFRPGLELEARWIASHYGYEDLQARVGTVGIIWTF
ncbi:MAG: hypothetical protein HGA66_08580 [Holophaga sp.]|nr:hypothetical protein [Holophaga sp.]